MSPVGTPSNRKSPKVSTGDAIGVPATLTFVVGVPPALAVPVPPRTTVPVIVAPPAPEGADGEPPPHPTVTRMATNDAEIRLRVIASSEANPRLITTNRHARRSIGGPRQELIDQKSNVALILANLPDTTVVGVSHVPTGLYAWL
jgi:hypothetical protein